MGPRRRLFRLGLGQPDPSRAVDWEIEHYLAEQTDRLMAEGWDEADARREAERRFGNLARHRRRMVASGRRRRWMRMVGKWWETVWSGMDLAWRGIRRSPGVALGVVLTLGLGIGANAAMFGLVDRLLLRSPDHIAHPEQVRRILREGEFLGRYVTTPALTYADIEDLRSVPEFGAVGGFGPARLLTLGTGEDASKVRVVPVTHDFLTTLGVRPRLGRFFTKDDDAIGARPTVVLSAEFWRRSFGADATVLGRTLEIEGNSYTVIGVAPRDFTGVNLTPVDLWLPAVAAWSLMERSDRFLTARGYWLLRAVVRVPNATAAEAGLARATVLHVRARAEQVAEGSYDGRTRLFTAPLIAARGPNADATSKVAVWLGGVSLAVLLIACANVANLLLARGTRRRREVAVRLALGGTRSRLRTAMAVESMTLAGLGGLAALATVRWGGPLIGTLLVPDVLWSKSGLDGRVLVVTVALTLAAGLLAGLGPAIRGASVDLTRDLAQGGRLSSLRRSGIRRSLILTQTALSAVLLVGAGLFLRSLHHANAVDIGLDAGRLVLARLEFRNADLGNLEANQLYWAAMARIRRLPSVTAAALSDVAFRHFSGGEVTLPGVDSLPIPRGTPIASSRVSPGYFETVGLRIIRGRALQQADIAAGERVAVVNETMARTLWRGQRALGQCFYAESTDCTSVVGVVEDASAEGLEGDGRLAFYLPFESTEMNAAAAELYIRTDGDAGDLAVAVAPILRSFSPAVRYARVQTVGEILAPEKRSWMLGASLFTAFGLLALVVAATGLYSLLAFDLAQRTREVGIRSALGASRGRLLWETMRQGAGLVVVGTLIGLGVCLVAAPYVQPLLFHVPGRDPLVLATVIGVLLAVSALASLPPGLRATRVDPAEALRAE